MLEFHPPRSPGRQVGLALLGAITLLDFGLLHLLLSQPVSFLTFLWGLLLAASLPALFLIVFLTGNLVASRYHVEGNALIVEWGRLKRLIPLPAIRQFITGLEVSRTENFEGIVWPGLIVGRATVHLTQKSANNAGRPGDLFFFATRDRDQQLLVVCDEAAYALTPQDTEDFVVCLHAVRDTGLAAEDDVQEALPDLLTWPLWRDWVAHVTVGLSVLLNAALFSFLAVVYGRLPGEVALHFDTAGQVSRTGHPASLFILPLIGLLTWLFNGFLGWLLYHFFLDRPVALIVWGATAVVQVTIWLVTFALLFAS
jgi:hypothetical protein